MLANLFRRLVRAPILRRFLWRRWYDYLARRHADRRWTFMNYGYQASGDGQLALEPADEPDRYCIQLYHRTVTDVELAGNEVLEVGSGRGGGASYIQRYLAPASTIGVDFSAQAVEFCKANHQVPGLSFRQGDAEALPFDDGSFDVVVNVESSHCYGSMTAFLWEVARVLRPGGHFCFADLRAGAEQTLLQEQLAASALSLVLEEEINREVLRAMEADSQRKLELIQGQFPRWLGKAFRDFAGLRESTVWRHLQSGQARYVRYVFRKAAS
ncbi:MAG: class I SAM-dependent methyltransferase [Candidatus Marinimicrobia bacterium]|nr:class I SAM-dependent methyltransferase [Candidatus Neomarinimicrobiota bacterium]